MHLSTGSGIHQHKHAAANTPAAMRQPGCHLAAQTARFAIECMRCCAGKLQADAAAAAGVKVFQFSMLEDVAKRTKARLLRIQ